MKMRILGALAVVVALGGSVVLLGIRRARGGGEEARTALTVSGILGTPADSGFARALEPRAFDFPSDHGPHTDFRTEWWYLTGNLNGEGGDAFGFQFTLFRNALRPPGAVPASPPPEGVSPWRAGAVYMGHLAVTDEKTGSFHAFERFSRGAGGLAGVRSGPFLAWLEDWELAGPEDDEDLFPLRLQASQDGVGIRLTLTPAKPLVLQGERGLSQKGPEPGNASFYYSFTRLEAKGDLYLGKDTVPVGGLAWMDREWSTSVLSPGQAGWDWFALQLGDGSDLMYYQLRRENGSADTLSAGVLVDAEGGSRTLASSAVRLEVLDRWRSPIDGTEYPSRWRLSVPDEELTLTLVPLLPHQELDLTIRYWEGAVRVSGMRRGEGIDGRGYVELTGYSDAGDGIRSVEPSRSRAPLP